MARPDVASVQNVTQSDNHVLGHRTTAVLPELRFAVSGVSLIVCGRVFSAVGKLLIRIGARRNAMAESTQPMV